MRASEALPVAACTVYNKYHNATSLARDTRRMAIVRLNYRMVETGPTRIVTTVHKVRSRIQNLCQSSGQLGSVPSACMSGLLDRGMQTLL